MCGVLETSNGFTVLEDAIDSDPSTWRQRQAMGLRPAWST